MIDTFLAFRIHERDGHIEARLERLRLADLSAGDVVVHISHSSINYKDALAASGMGRILRHYPLVGGIDLAGTVEQSADPAVRVGDAVLVTGCGLSETRDGGFAQYARVPASSVVPIPSGLSAASSMAIGTAGFAAARAILRMQANGQTPQLGPVVVTGATGGVGSLAIDMLSSLGYEVVALTGKPQAAEYLRTLGAAQVLSRADLTLGGSPLEPARWGGAIDNVGGELLSWLLRTTREGGSVASVGLAASAQLSMTVMPFILRGVSLLGVNSASLGREERLKIWVHLATDLKPRHLEHIVRQSVNLEQLPSAFDAYLSAQVVGRTLVQMGERR